MKKPVRLLLLSILVLAPAVALAKISPDLSSAESSVKTFFTHQREADINGKLDMFDLAEWDLRQQRTDMEWFKDKTDREKRIKNQTALIEFVKANLSELKKYSIDVVNKTDVDKSNITVECRIKGKRPSEKKGEDNKFELKDEDEKDSRTATLLDGKWKIKQ